MDTWIWQPLTYISAVGSHSAALLSGVLGFLLSLWFAYRHKKITFSILITFAILCIIISMYQAWEDEYIKNVGDAYFTFRYLHPENAIDTVIDDVRISLRNETAKSIEVEELRIVRVWVRDDAPEMNEARYNWCKEVNTSPRVARHPAQPDG
jgi:hypothetical protein